MEPGLIGIVRADISSIFFEELSRPTGDDRSITQYLTKVFDEDRCDRENPNHFLKGLISPRQRDILLQDSRVRKDLRESLVTNYHPRLRFDEKIYCHQGYHRIQAAGVLFEFNHNESWWTVRLYCFTSAEERSRFARKEREHFHHQTHYSSGDIYQKVTHYKKREEPEAVEEWKIRLSDCQQVCLSQFLKNHDFVNAFDDLKPFPGLWKGFELSNVQKHFALHCEEELLHCVRHIRLTLDKFTFGIFTVQQAVDIHSVEQLQSRAPSSSSIDRDLIASGMDDGTLLSAITNKNLRQLVKEALLDLDVMIPTIKTFHMNVNYFQIGSKILRAHLFQTQSSRSLFATACDHWSPPEKFLVEVREGYFEHVNVPIQEQFYLAYIQLWLFVLRHFPSLSNWAPRLDKRRRNPGDDCVGSIDSARVILLQKLAHRVGFSSEKILHSLKQQVTTRSRDWKSSSSLHPDGEDINRRCGRPFASSFTHIEKHLFLPNLSSINEKGALNPSVLFVQQDIIKAFFGSRVNSIVMRNRIGQTVSLPDDGPVETPSQARNGPQPRQPRGRPRLRKEPQPRKSPRPKEVPDKTLHKRDNLEDLKLERKSTVSQVASVQRQDYGSPTRSSFAFRVIERHTMGQHPVNYIHNLQDIKRYLLGRQGWVMVTLCRGVLKTLRHEDIGDYMMNNPEGEYFMVSADYIQYFIQNQYKALRVIEACESKVESRKRTRVR